jgi:hypothetical protein
MENGHADGLFIDRIDNDGGYCPENCRWVTNTENIRNSTVAKLTADKVREIRARFARGGITKAELARRYGVGFTAIADAIAGRTWNGVPHKSAS